MEWPYTMFFVSVYYQLQEVLQGLVEVHGSVTGRAEVMCYNYVVYPVESQLNFGIYLVLFQFNIGI